MELNSDGDIKNQSIKGALQTCPMAKGSASVRLIPIGQNEAFSPVLIDKALKFSGWDLLDPEQVRKSYCLTTR